MQIGLVAMRRRRGYSSGVSHSGANCASSVSDSLLGEMKILSGTAGVGTN